MCHDGEIGAKARDGKLQLREEICQVHFSFAQPGNAAILVARDVDCVKVHFYWMSRRKLSDTCAFHINDTHTVMLSMQM